MRSTIHRRDLLRAAALGSTGLLLGTDLTDAQPPAEKLNVALIGIGGRGRWFVDTMPNLANVVALCDVNDERAGDAYQVIPQAKKYYDFRVMLEEMDRQIDAVVIATPDNTHAVAAAMAMKMGKHVYCEKPLTHDLYEARYLRDLARQTGVATQLGNQGTASEAFRRAFELIEAGVLGEIREVYAWNDSGGAGARPTPQGPQPVPTTLQWDLWLGPAADRSFHPDWLGWHTWRDFGTGQLGNWAVHTMNLAFKSLHLDAMWYPDQVSDKFRPASRTFTVEARVSSIEHDTFPQWEQIDYRFPSRGELPPVEIHWANGSRGPNRRAQIEDRLGRRLDWGDAGDKKWRDHAGLLMIGSRGKLHTTGHNAEFTLLPEKEYQGFQGPEPTLPRSRGHEQEWLMACLGGAAAWSNFDYGGPLTEYVLLGNIATSVEGAIEYDAVNGTIVNHAAASKHARREYRVGWTL